MGKIILLLLALLFSTQSHANGSISFNSEISHAFGGAVTAGAIVAISDDFWPNYDRAWMGFTISTVVGSISQYYEYAQGENDFRNAFADALSHALGSAIGAYVTDKYILLPVIHTTDKETYMGLSIQFRL
ncbi:hypothetical protein [Shewanella sp. SG41-4]|jgi:hypothetical protein|uniref:hypothetical protein n=1 Tax=Shewanella sp. SG41-4 TaxID=2760976 RepID=UPI001C72999D|nr:hypothetical protein [Shewanella sp. SG41-4]